MLDGVFCLFFVLFCFCCCIVSFCYSSTFRGIENQNVLLEISVSSLSLLLFTWCMWFFVFVSRFLHLDLDLLNLIPSPVSGSPAFLIESMVWMWAFSSVGIRMYCLKFVYFHFSPPVRLLRVVICFSFVFYLSRSRSPRCFALTASSALLTESYGVSVGI